MKFSALQKRLPLKRLRLIPAVIVLGTVLLAIKAAGLAADAQAQEQQQSATTPAPAPAAAPSDQAPQASGPDADDEETSTAQVDVLTSLAKRRAELDARERDLDMRENLIEATEKRVDGKIDSLKQLQTAIQGLLVQRDDADQKQIGALVKAYSAMPPKDAARIFDSLNDEVLLAVASTMKPADLAPVLAKMQPDAAEKLTVRLANRLKLSAAQEQIVPAASPALAAAMPSTQAAPSSGTPADTPSQQPSAPPGQAAAPAANAK